MPYIGRNHIAGDHTSNFKVLDDISSYTATFNGSSALIISTTDNTIRIPEHRFIQGQRVTYSNGGGGNIGGLTNGTAYFVTFDTANTFKLATSLANANNNTNINLSSVGTGSAHTLTAAFDGVNTTFKITHGGGSSADIVNSAQLQIAINNVIQKANLDSSYSEGFLVVDSRKIQFKTAPTVDDIFWGNIIANTIETFDISDLKIDQFTGDGVTTQFTLSRDVPNNQSVMVTLDGVVQHPSDKDTTRAYRILADTVIEFSSPPGLSIEIQVRHLGFAGASTGDVTGFYGRTGNVVLGASDHITTGDITPRNINASGIVTASSFVGNLTGNVSGNLTVGGVLTYEDVTNVDSIGIITARSDIHVGAGVSAVGVGTFGGLDLNGDLDVDGHTNLDNVSIAGVTTFSGSIGGTATFQDIDVDGHTNLDNVSIAGVTTASDNIIIPDNKKLILGTQSGRQLEIFHNTSGSSNHRIQSTSSTNFLNIIAAVIAPSADTFVFKNNAGNKSVLRISADTSTKLYFNGNEKLTTENTGVNITGIVTATSADINGDLDVDGHTNLDNVSIAGVVTATSFSGDGSNLTGITQTTINSNTNNYLITGTGTANTLQGESGLTYNGSTLALAGSLAMTGGSISLDSHSLISTAGFTDISGGSYAARLGSTGSSTIRSTQIYGGGNHIATFDGVNYRLGIYETTPEAGLHITGGLPSIRLENSGTSASANDIFGQIDFKHNDSSDAGVTAAIKCVAEDANGNSFLAFYNGDGGNADERLRIDSSGHLHTGYTSSFGNDHINILASDGGGIAIASNNVGNATTGDILGSLSFQGYLSGAGYGSAEARISAIVSANHTGSSAATDMVFYTKPSSTGPGSAPTERVRITSDGNMGVGVLEPKSKLHLGSIGDIRFGSQYGGFAHINQQIQYAAGYTGTHWMFETNNMISWSFDGVLIVYGGGGSSYGSEVTKITIVYSRESGANNSGDMWRNGTTSYNIETLGHAQVGLNPSAGELTVTEDTAPDGAASQRSLFKLGWTTAGHGGATTTWSKLHGTMYWGTGSSGDVEIQDKDGNIFWDSNP